MWSKIAKLWGYLYTTSIHIFSYFFRMTHWFFHLFDFDFTGMHCIREFFIVIDAPYSLLEASYECCVVEIHNTTQYEVIPKVTKTPDKWIYLNEMDAHHKQTTHNMFNTLANTHELSLNNNNNNNNKTKGMKNTHTLTHCVSHTEDTRLEIYIEINYPYFTY